MPLASSACATWRLSCPCLVYRCGGIVRIGLENHGRTNFPFKLLGGSPQAPNERSDHTLSATAVVNEAYVRLASRDAPEGEDRSHFYNVAASIMRHVLIDHARSHRAGKRGGGATKQELDESIFPSVTADDEGFRIAEQALETFAQEHERAALVVTLKVFGGLTIPEIAREVRVAERTVKNDWALARERLAVILQSD